MPTNNLLDMGLIRLPEVLAVFPVSKSTWWAGVREGKYPPTVHLSTRVSAWRVKDIKALIEGVAE